MHYFRSNVHMVTYVCFDHMVTYGKMTIKSDIPLLPRSLKILSKPVSNPTAFYILLSIFLNKNQSRLPK